MLHFKKRGRVESTLSRNKSMNRSLRVKDKKRRLHDQLHVGIQDKLEREINIRDGAARLLAACTHEDQLLEAAKSLHTSNARMYSLMAELQKIKTAEIMSRALDVEQSQILGNVCKGRIALSDIRIPLMWGDPSQPATKHKDSGRHAVFCLTSIASEVQDTTLVCTDRTTTDICFTDVIIFEDVAYDFEMEVDILAFPMSEESICAQTPQKLFSKLNRSIGKKEGRQLRERLKESPAANMKVSPQFQKLGSLKLNLGCVSKQSRSHDITGITSTNSVSARVRPTLPLYGSFSCQLVAQPKCITEKSLSGFLNCMEMLGSIPSWSYMWCEVQAGRLSCWSNPEDAHDKVANVSFPIIAQDIKVNEIERTRQKRPNSFQIRDTYERHIFATDDKNDVTRWVKGLRQHKFDCDAWRGACVPNIETDTLTAMEIASPSPAKLTPTVTNRYTPKYRQAYNNIAIDSPTTTTDNEEEEKLHASPTLANKPWSGLFSGALRKSATKITTVKDIQNFSPTPEKMVYNISEAQAQAKPPIPRRPAHEIVERKKRERNATLKRIKRRENSGSCSDTGLSDAYQSSDDVFMSESDDIVGQQSPYEVISSHDDVVNKHRITSPPQRTSTKKKSSRKKRRAPMPPPLAPIQNTDYKNNKVKDDTCTKSKQPIREQQIKQNENVCSVKTLNDVPTKRYLTKPSASSSSSLDDILEEKPVRNFHHRKAAKMTEQKTSTSVIAKTNSTSARARNRGVKVLPRSYSPGRDIDEAIDRDRCQSWDADNYLRSSGQRSKNHYEEIRPRTCSVPRLDVLKGHRSPRHKSPRSGEMSPVKAKSPLSSLGKKPVAVPRRSYLTAVEGSKQITPERPEKSDKVKSRIAQSSNTRDTDNALNNEVENNLPVTEGNEPEPVYAKVNKNRSKPRPKTRELHVGVDAYTKAHRAIITVCKQRMEEEEGKKVRVMDRQRSTRAYDANGKIIA